MNRLSLESKYYGTNIYLTDRSERWVEFNKILNIINLYNVRYAAKPGVAMKLKSSDAIPVKALETFLEMDYLFNRFYDNIGNFNFDREIKILDNKSIAPTPVELYGIFRKIFIGGVGIGGIDDNLYKLINKNPDFAKELKAYFSPTIAGGGWQPAKMIFVFFAIVTCIWMWMWGAPPEIPPPKKIKEFMR